MTASENHFISAFELFTQMTGLLKFWHLLLPRLFFFLRDSQICTSLQTHSIFVDGLAHLDWDFMEVGQPACRADRGWWMQAGLDPCDQKFSCKWDLSFLEDVSLHRLPIYLASPLHIISSLFSHFCLFQNAILHKILRIGLWKFKPAFLRM